MLEQYYLQHAEHCFRQLDVTVKETNTNTEDLPKTIVSKKIIKKSLLINITYQNLFRKNQSQIGFEH